MGTAAVRLVAKVAADNADLAKTLKRTKTLHTKLQINDVIAAGAAGILATDLISQVSADIAANGTAADKKRWEKEAAKKYVPHVQWISKQYRAYIDTVGEYDKPEPKAKKADAPAAEATPAVEEPAL
jgi:hypothetical protein